MTIIAVRVTELDETLMVNDISNCPVVVVVVDMFNVGVGVVSGDCPKTTLTKARRRSGIMIGFETLKEANKNVIIYNRLKKINFRI